MMVGLDVGSVRTKIARAARTRSVATPPGRTGRVVADLLTAEDGPPGIAVPPAWLHDGTGTALLACLPEGTGARLVPAGLCVAATVATTGLLAICDVGASSIDTTLCERSEGTVRLLVHHTAEVPDVETAMLRAAGAPADGLRRTELAAERFTQGARATALLERAARDPRYRDTPLYPRSGVSAGIVLDVLVPVAEATASAVSALCAGISWSLQVVLTGGNVLPPVRAAVEAAGAGPVLVVPPESAAVGARLVAAGEIGTLLSSPHTLGVAIRRIRHGVLEAAILPVPSADSDPLVVTVEEGRGFPVRVRVDGIGPWRTTSTNIPGPPPGVYGVHAVDDRPGLGAVLLTPEGKATATVIVLDREPGPVVDGVGS